MTIDYVVQLDRRRRWATSSRAGGEDCVLGKGINVRRAGPARVEASPSALWQARQALAGAQPGCAQGLKADFVHLDHGMTHQRQDQGRAELKLSAGPDIPEAAMKALEKKLDALQKDDILVLAGSIPASLAQTTYERLLAGWRAAASAPWSMPRAICS